jgi:carboxyl-terminal processing protease
MNYRGCKGPKKLVLLLLVLTILLTPIASIAESNLASETDLDYFLKVKNLIEKNYYIKPSEKELMEGAIKGLFWGLDENSNYYTKEEFEMLLEDISGDFVGIGVYIKEEEGSIIIESPIEGGPAQKAGVKMGDKIVSVDGKNIKGMSTPEVIDLMKGEPNTKVKLGIEREKKPMTLEVKREIITINPVEYKILKDNIGYIKINQFNQHTYDNLVPVLSKFYKENISNIVIDLRDNPGGLLDEVVEILGLFIPEGPIVHIKYRGDIERTYYSKLKKPKYKLAVLINENSASASEIFAGAVQDTKVGTIVGVPSYGKGTVQQIVPLPNGDGMKLTIAEYLTPNKRSIHKKGIKPDIIVENKDDTKDTQLEKAIEALHVIIP